jgi:predicted ABC-type ATPase
MSLFRWKFWCCLKMKQKNNSRQLYMIGGPNGAGKTTAAMSLLPELLDCYEYVNADSIAAALSPFAPETTAIQAGRLMLDRINHLAAQKKDFAFETTMASRSFYHLLERYKQEGYRISLIFFWLQSSELAIERVRDRVQNGGHNIPDNIVLRRYSRSIKNFMDLYLPIANDWMVFDNSFTHPVKIAEKNNVRDHNIINKQAWNTFRNHI